jgi:hypothetical protein
VNTRALNSDVARPPGRDLIVGRDFVVVSAEREAGARHRRFGRARVIRDGLQLPQRREDLRREFLMLRELRIRGHLAHRIEQAAILLCDVLVADSSGCGTGRYEQRAMVPLLGPRNDFE